MDVTSIASVLTTQRATFLSDLSNLARASESRIQASNTAQLTEDAQNLLSVNTGISYTDPYRGQNLDITV